MGSKATGTITGIYYRDDTKIELTKLDYDRLMAHKHSNDIIVRMLETAAGYVDVDTLRLILNVPKTDKLPDKDKSAIIDAITKKLAELARRIDRGQANPVRQA